MSLAVGTTDAALVLVLVLVLLLLLFRSYHCMAVPHLPRLHSSCCMVVLLVGCVRSIGRLMQWHQWSY